MNQSTLQRFTAARARWEEANRILQAALENLISSSDLNNRHDVTSVVGSLRKQQDQRSAAWSAYLEAEEQLVRDLNEGLFPGEHRSGA